MQFLWADFRLDVDARTLERAGRPVRVQTLALDLLALLLRHRGRVVSDEFLRKQVWRGAAVSDSSLRQLVKEARRAIGDDGRGQRQIETLRAQGLRWIAPALLEGGGEKRDLEETAARRGARLTPE